MKILGISGLFHDSAAAILKNGEILAAAQEERFTRIKHDSNFPVNAIKYCLEEANIKIDELDAIAYYEKPNLRFERFLDAYIHYAPQGFIPFLKHMPIWINDKVNFKRMFMKNLKSIQGFDASKVKILYPEHHLSHAASTYYPSTFDEAAILTIDGVGEWASASICYGDKNKIKIIKEMRFPHSLGFLYSAFTQFLGFKINNGEYKVMGLAPYGKLNSDQVNNFVKIAKENLVDIAEDGSIWLNQEFFQYATASGGMIKPEKWEKIFGVSVREQDTKLEQLHCDLALAVQLITEEAVLKMAAEAKKLTGSENICLSGGVALNCVANGKLLKTNMFKNIYIQPASGDAGCSLGAALAAHYIYFDQPRKATKGMDAMKGAYLGPQYGEKEIKELIQAENLEFQQFQTDQELCEYVANCIKEGNVIGWFQGRMEFGPRSLGNRSILGDATNLEMQKRINLKIKFREGFRPFAPSVLEEECQEYFNLDVKSPYMLVVTDIQKSHMKELPANYESMHWRDKLDVERSDIQSITHVNFSARIQTVTTATNKRYHMLIESFKSLTGYGLLVNTSFNVRGEPIVNTPADAYRCFMKTNMDFLVLDNYVFSKKGDAMDKSMASNSLVTEKK